MTCKIDPNLHVTFFIGSVTYKDFLKDKSFSFFSKAYFFANRMDAVLLRSKILISLENPSC